MKPQKDYIILLHGFLRTSASMKKLEKHLSKKGYKVINLNYPSKKHNIADLSQNFLAQAIKKNCTDKSKRIHFVTHSMGGILVRYFLAKNKLKNLGRIVMLAPPNKGSKLADILSKSKLTKRILGPALKELKTDNKSLIQSLPPANYELGIIAGKFDAKVPPKNSKLKGMKDFLTIPCTHAFIMNKPKTITATKDFIETGKF
ncbi:alpha/beta hydrolase [Candidatus Peregrinibacteria bacterium]|nr:alpha/beta hydrolase [Candidatus Peregrinibacteria bacterium]